MNALEIEEIIRRAFDDVESQIEDVEFSSDFETKSCMEAFEGYSWKTISLDQVREGFDCIVFLNEEDQYTLLPAWLIASLKWPDENVYGWTMSLLRREDGWKSRCTLTQVEAVLALLLFFIDQTADNELETEAYSLWRS